jgi:hypothetical protein
MAERGERIMPQKILFRAMESLPSRPLGMRITPLLPITGHQGFLIQGHHASTRIGTVLVLLHLIQIQQNQKFGKPVNPAPQRQLWRV